MTTDEKKRDPSIDPIKGDVLRSLNQTKWLIVDEVDAGEVVYRVFTSIGGPIASCRIPLEEWRDAASNTLGYWEQSPEHRTCPAREGDNK